MALRFHWFISSRKTSIDGTRSASGRMRRWLRRLGPSWAASPARRLVQTGCLLLFLALFFWVCWPYSAEPAATWRGWVPIEVDTVTGRITVARDQPPEPPILAGSAWYVADESDAQSEAFGAFRVVDVHGDELTLVPAHAHSGRMDRLAMSLGPWSLSAGDPSLPPSHYAADLARKQRIPVATFLALDPLMSLSASLASRLWIWSLAWAGVVMAVCLVIPRGFCGYVCPLGTLIDLFDWAVGRRISRFRVSRAGWWAWLRYGLLAAVLASALCGVLLAGFVAAIPVLTRGMVFLFAPLQDGLLRGWPSWPPLEASQWVSIGLFVGVLALGLLGPRFWCRYVCPTGAVFSLASLLRLHQRHVGDNCAGCGQCAAHCPFDAVETDFSTRTADCAFCQTCGGVCPTETISFKSRWTGIGRASDFKLDPEAIVLGRRGLLAAGITLGAGCLAGIGGASLIGLRRRTSAADSTLLVRPPGSVPETDFARMCVACGQCLRACPNNALQPLGLSHGIESLWTPR
ncbi:MAG: 4Fe-4S binding protein, partial [Patescibacteria group bacterium]|nr:4Fe-4S binding protein [Patescibacteria group bacterium]